jgi:fructuronate reductase
VRVLPVLRAERTAGRVPKAACRTLAAWVLSLRAPDGAAPDPSGAELVSLANGELAGAVSRVLGALDVALPDDDELTSAVVAAAEDLQATSEERIRP